MSDFSPSEVDDEQESPGDFRRRLEAESRKAKDAEDRAAAAERELAFAKAGLPLDDPKMGYFVKGYDGDLEPQAIKAAAESAGFLAPPAPAVPPQELVEHQTAANLAAGGQAEPAWTGAVHDNPAYQQEMRQSRSVAETLAVMAKHGSPILDDID